MGSAPAAGPVAAASAAEAASRGSGGTGALAGRDGPARSGHVMAQGLQCPSAMKTNETPTPTADARTPNAKEEQKKFRKLVGAFDEAMLTTRSKRGTFRARPMYLARAEDDGDVWFLTSLDSGKLDELEIDPRVGVSMQGTGKFLSLSGRAEVVSRRDVLDDLWNPALKPWFPEGTDTADMTALHVVTEEAEYWDRSGWQGLKFALEAAKAVIEGRRPDDDPPARHGHVRL